MTLTKESMLTGKNNTKDINMSEKEYNECIYLWENGKPIEEAFPKLSKEEYDFMIMGTLESDWNSLIS